MNEDEVHPARIRRISGGLEFEWRDGHLSSYQNGYLRRRCPCAGCREAEPKVVEADDPLKLLDDEPIELEDVSLVGNYAVSFRWNDGHSTGIYSFRLLRAICPCSQCGRSGLEKGAEDDGEIGQV
ncbi:MAG TPA: DUF971 domain-containing protein [Acidobacteriota bacterium]|nr:DUF971 domain-containing protein [Acidobacteriota bacterium]